MNIQLPELAGQDLLLFGGVFLLGLLVLMLVLLPRSGDRKRFQRRVQRVRRSRQEQEGEAVQVVNVKRRTRDSDIAFLDRLIKQVVPRREELRKRLDRAGLETSIGKYMLICLVCGVLVFGAAAASRLMPLAATGFVGVFGAIGLPYLFVAYLGRRRQAKFIKYFPEAIDLMVRGIKSGLPITEALQTAGQEIPDPVGLEMRRATDAVRMGTKLEDVLWETARRLSLQEFDFFVVSLSIQSETGGNLAETLENLSNVLRGRRQLKLKIKALSSEAKASAYIIGSLPFVMGVLIYLVNPDYIMDLFIDPRGHFLIGLGLCSFGIGAFVMYRMIKFEI